MLCQIQTCSKFNIVVLSLSAYTLSLFDLPDALMMVDDGEENPLQALIYAREGACNPFCLLIWIHWTPLTITQQNLRVFVQSFIILCSDVFRYSNWMYLSLDSNCALYVNWKKTWVRICDEFRRIVAIIERRPLDWGLNFFKLDDTNFKSW